MKVHELIARLQECKQDAEVMITTIDDKECVWSFDSIDYILIEKINTKRTKIVDKEGNLAKYVVAFCPYDIDTFDRLNAILNNDMERYARG